MIPEEERQRVWTNAYDTALTGLLLASRISGVEKRWGLNNVYDLTVQCKAFADQALNDADEFEA